MPLDLLTAPTACCTPASAPTMSVEDAERAARTLKALADPVRLRLLSILASRGGEACVCDLTEPLDLAQPTVSHHLKVLTEAGFVTREKRGVWAYFTLVPGVVDALAAHLTEHVAVRAAGAAQSSMSPVAGSSPVGA